MSLGLLKTFSLSFQSRFQSIVSSSNFSSNVFELTRNYSAALVESTAPHNPGSKGVTLFVFSYEK